MRAIADFQLLEELYSSSNTRVCRAIRIEYGIPVILKILSGEYLQSDAFVQYQREYQIIDSLKDIEGVINVYNLANIQNSLMIVEEDIGARSLDMILAAETIELKEALQLAIRLAGILDQIHLRRVIHKDINPSNIVWNRLTDELRVVDFGIASQLSQEHQEFQSVNQLEGNLAYTSPEQTGRINRKLDYRSDLYSLGISLYQLFTGTLPFIAQDGIELVHAHIAVMPVSPSELNPQIPLMLSRIIMRLIEKMADDRYQSAQGLQHDLERCLEQLQETGGIAVFPLAVRDVSIKFQMPQKLYGREQEISSIIKAFDRTAQGSIELLLVTGLSGTGKSALVHEVHKPLTEKRGNFVAGKFDQYQRDIPFYAWTQALEAFCKLLLKEDEASIELWRERISAALGNIGKVITDVIPSIEIIIGKQPEVPPLSGEQALNRLNYAFGNFLEAICREEHPLVIFIDDWQWADAGSLSLLKSVTGSKAIKYLLLIGAYRENEAHAAHPFTLALEDIKKNEAEVNTINLQDLQQHDVGNLIKDLLNDAPGLDDITRLVYEKTRGNAFFLIQLLNDLYEKLVIRFCSSKQHWVWQQQEIESRTVADNVIELMTEKIRKLPESTQCSITHGACIGDRFDLATLAAIQGKPAHETANDLEPALIEGILVPIDLNYRVAKQENNTSNVFYQFIHDRVRQAAYGMLEQIVMEETHYAIAKIWLEETGTERQNRPIFDIANQYNAGRRLVIQAGLQKQLIGINLEAGKRAKNATDYASALHYFQIALELQAPDCWQTTPEQSAELQLLAAEMAFLSKDYASMELWLDDYLDHLSAPLEQVKAFKIRLQAYVAQNRLSEALDAALYGLRLLGINLPKSPSMLQVMLKLLQTKAILKNKSLADLHALPEMTDPAKLEAMELLGLAIPPAYWTSQELVSLIVFQMIHESVIHGYSPNAGYGYSWWGITECAMLGNINAGYEFGEFAIELAKKHQLNLQQPLFFSAWIIQKFKQPLREAIPVFEQTYALSLEKGDFEYASYARNNAIQTLFHSGLSLDVLLPEMELAHRDLLRFQLGSSLYWHGIWWQTALNFVQESAQPHLLSGPAYDESISLPQHLKVNDASTLFLLYCAKLMLSYFFSEKDHALNNARQARLYLKGGIGMHAFALFHFYESLALLANIENLGIIDKQVMLFKVRVNQRKLKKWAVYAPDNYRHHWLLVEAERLRASGQSDKAMRYYDLAIDQAQRNGFIHEEALANELAVRCYIQRGQSRLALYYLKRALYLYERWGSHAKVAQLKTEFAHQLLTVTQSVDHHSVLKSHLIPRGSGGNTQQVGAFDVSAIIQASQAISGEIQIDKLITTLLKIAIKYSGAQKALLILNNGKKLSIQAQGLVKQDAIDVKLDNIEINDWDDLPLSRSIIQYVSRTLTAQVIHDARDSSQFSQDPYILRGKPLSMLCMPIVQQGKLMGMLYLENHLTVGAFTEQRFELLRLLSSQAAISIENANLYGFLEQKVEERTQKLQASLEAQERLNSELQVSSRELKNAHAELSEANLQLQRQANTDGLTGLANRRYFIERLQYELDRCAREQQPVALIMSDLDHFKQFNDTYGHVEGDECLRKTAKAFSAVFNRATDLVARYGGEEFVILLPRTTLEQAAHLGSSLCKTVEALNIPHAGNAQYGVATLSAGCYLFIPDANTVLEAVIEQADKALYQAKNQGRNCFVQIREGQEAFSF